MISFDFAAGDLLSFIDFDASFLLFLSNPGLMDFDIAFLVTYAVAVLAPFALEGIDFSCFCYLGDFFAILIITSNRMCDFVTVLNALETNLN